MSIKGIFIGLVFSGHVSWKRRVFQFRMLLDLRLLYGPFCGDRSLSEIKLFPLSVRSHKTLDLNSNFKLLSTDFHK